MQGPRPALPIGRDPAGHQAAGQAVWRGGRQFDREVGGPADGLLGGKPDHQGQVLIPDVFLAPRQRAQHFEPMSNRNLLQDPGEVRAHQG